MSVSGSSDYRQPAHVVVTVAVLVAMATQSQAATKEDYSNLMDFLFKDYRKEVRPVDPDFNFTIIFIKFSLFSIIDVSDACHYHFLADDSHCFVCLCVCVWGHACGFIMVVLNFSDERTGPDNEDKRFVGCGLVRQRPQLDCGGVRRDSQHPGQAEQALATRHRGGQHGDPADRAGLQESPGWFM